MLPPTSANASGMPPVYFEAAAIITALVLLGQVLELRARSTTAGAIKALLGLAPKTARGRAPLAAEEDIALERGRRRAIACACGRAKKCRSTA